VLLLTPTGSLPSPRWRWWARATVAAPVALLLVAPFAPGRFDPRLLVTSSPFNGRALGGVMLAATQVALTVTTTPWWWAVGRWWCASAAPAGSNASSSAGWRWRRP
jgi:hypothetical protein